MSLNYFNSISIVFKTFSNTKVIVTQIVMTQYIVSSSSLSVISQRPIYRSLPIYQNSWLSFRSKSFSKMSRQFLRLLKIMAPVLNIDFIHAALKEISYFLIVNKPQVLTNTT